ncbi:MAG TPA: hypothetical protein VFG46_24450, partial [Chryseolinea sp.]|nr:hypothetical protein [Chryseolinea sp.]
RSPLFGIVFLLCLLGGSFQLVSAQSINYFTLPAWTNVTKVPWRKSIYRFQEFQKGKITYTKGFELDYEFDLNYNVYNETMDFINEAGDTLSIMNMGEIRAIQIGNKTFFHEYNSGYYEVLLRLPVALAFRNQFVLDHIESNNGHQGPGPTVQRGVVATYDRTYVKVFSYFFIDQNNEVKKATRAAVLKMFPGHNTEIKGYLLEHDVDFDSREDLIELTIYCNQFIDVHASDSTAVNDIITVRLPAGKRLPSKKIMTSLYRFPEFQEAKVMWADKSSSFHNEKMNYNLFTGKMDVVDEKGDTLKFTRWHETKIVNLGGDVFFQDSNRGYLEILLQGNLGLAVKNNFRLVTDKILLEDEGLVDQASASDVSNKTSVAPYDRLYQLHRTYFFIYRNQAYEANKVSILTLMQRHKDVVVEYMNENKISLANDNDLKELTTFCNGILSK